MTAMNYWGICGMIEEGAAMEFQEFFLIPSEYLENSPLLVGPAVNKKTTYFKNIRVRECLEIELRFSATGKTFYSVMYLFEFSKAVNVVNNTRTTSL
jgi:hypothetical protein